MKKFLSTVLAIAFVLSLCTVPVFALNTTNFASAKITWKTDHNELEIKFSDSWSTPTDQLNYLIVAADVEESTVNSTARTAGAGDQWKTDMANGTNGVAGIIPGSATNNVAGATITVSLDALPKTLIKGGDTTAFEADPDDASVEWVDEGAGESAVALKTGKVQIYLFTATGATNTINNASKFQAQITNGMGEVTKEDPTDALYTVGDAKTYNATAQNPAVTPGNGAGAVTNTYLADDDTGTNKTAANAGKTNAGTYHVFVDVAASALYNAKTDLYLGTWTINQADLTGTTVSVGFKTDANSNGVVETGDVIKATYTAPTGLVAGTDYEYKWTVDGTEQAEKGAEFTAPAGWAGGALAVQVVAKGTNTKGSTNKATLASKTVPTLTDNGSNTTVKYGDTGKKLVFTTNSDKPVTYTVATGDDVIEVGTDGALTIKKAGTATVTVAVAESDTYAAKSQTVTITVDKAKPVITLNNATQTEGSVTGLTGTLTPNSAGATITYQYETEDAPVVTPGNCDCALGKAAAHTKACAKVADPTAECNCGAAEGVAADVKHGDSCAYGGDAGVSTAACDCSARDGLTDADDHAEGCAAVAAPTKSYKTLTGAEIAALKAGTYNVKANCTGDANLDAADEVTAVLTVTAPAPPSFGGGGGGTTVSYVAGAHGTLNGKTSESVTNGATPKDVPTPVADAGWAFVGWSADGGKTLVDPAKVAVTSSVTYTAYFGHAPYMIGREEGLFKPFGALTRAEAVTMLSRLTAGFSEDGNYANNNFSDVELNDWFADYIGFGVSHNIVVGYDDGTYKPNQAVTRGEFATMVARYLGLQEVSGNAFPDCADHWAAGAVNALAQAGIVDGYEDGTFRPERTITRAEAAKMVNLAVKRAPQSKDISKYGNPYTDVPTSEWFFYDVMEASIPHIVEDLH